MYAEKLVKRFAKEYIDSILELKDSESFYVFTSVSCFGFTCSY